jgi:NTE family protein
VSSALRRRGPTPRTVLAIASLGAAVAFVDATIVNIAFPNIERSFHGTSISTLSWVLNAYNIVFAAFLVAAGRIADLLGRRRVFVFGLELFTVASVLCAVAPSAAALIGFRVVQALGAAFLVPSSLALVLNAFPAERRSHGVALLSAVGAAAAGLGPSLGGLLVAADSWRLVFLVNVPIGVGAVWLARRRLVESRTPGRRRLPDLLGALLFALSIAALILGVVEGQAWGWSNPRIIASFCVAAGLGAAFVWRSMSHPSPIIDLSLLRGRTFSVANAMTIIAAAGFYGYTLLNVLFLTGVWGYSVLQAGLAMTIGPVVAVLVAVPTSRLVQRVGHRPVVVVGGLFWGGAVLWFVERTTATPDFRDVWLPGMVLLGIGAGTLFPNLSGAAVASAPGERFATATAMNSVARQVGAALGVALVVAILGTPSALDAVTAFHHAWTFGAVCLAVAGIGGLFVARLQVPRTPPLAEVARAILLTPDLAGARAVPAPRARRAISFPSGAPAPRAQSTAEFLATVPLFSGLPPELHTGMAARARQVQLGPGDWLFHEGDAGDAMFVVRTGRLEVVDGTTHRAIRELGRGDALGELALLTDMPRSASVRAARASDLLVVSREEFANLLESSPALALAMNRTLAAQLRDARTPAPSIRPRPATVVLVSLDPGAAGEEVARRLAEALGTYQSCRLLDGREVPVAAPSSDASRALYAPLLDHAEAEHDLVLLWAGSLISSGALSGASAWTQFCLQQADRILALTRGGPAGSALGSRVELRGCDLVAWDAAPGALDGWAEILDPIESHLLRSETLDADIERLARRVSGRSVGIVLSGGGARAFAHIGVLDELNAAGLVIDRVAGVSMGAFVGALYAMGRDPEEIDAICFDEWVQRRPLSDYTFPRHSLIRGERFRTMLQRTFGSTLIEELPRSFMCGYSELRSGTLVLARHGPLWERVGFSICLPVIAPPQVRGRDVYIDGSLVDNLPVQAMADLAEGPIVAVDVKASLEPPLPAAGDGASRGRRERPPSLGETLARVLLLGSSNTSEAARQHADLVITPRAEGVGLLEFHQLDAAREAGRLAAREALKSAASGLLSGL